MRGRRTRKKPTKLPLSHDIFLPAMGPDPILNQFQSFDNYMGLEILIIELILCFVT